MQDKENKKTLIYIFVAGIALLMAIEPWRPAPDDHSAPPAVGTKVFPEFKDPLNAKSLEITKFDESNATIHPFKVAQVNGVWSIPSHSNYPADAREHMAAAATALLGLEVLGVASTNAGDKELYGVITPDPKELRQGMTGVGTRVTMKDGKDRVLADLVIGKEVKDNPQLRYVRKPNQDQIYRVQIATDKLSTKFEDWIEKDLLKLNAFDVKEVSINDYSIDENVSPSGGLQLRMNPRLKMMLAYDDTKSSWSLVDLSEFDEQGKPAPATLADDEELNNEKLNALKSALDDLQIIDVERKPKGLSQDLRVSEEFVKDSEAQQSLIMRGFYPVPMKDRVEMFSSEGEATCTTKDGVRYILRFGRLAGGTESLDDKENKDDKEPKSNPALNRYLFVMAEFDESQIPKPQLEEVPGETQPADDQTPPENADEPKAEESKPEEPKADEAAPEAGDEKPQAEAQEVPEEKTALQEEADTEPAADAPKDSDAAEESADSSAPGSAGGSAKPDAEEPKADEAKPETPPTPEEAKRIAIRKENKRKQTEYDDAVKKGQDKVKELNDRFADWYFIISDDIYKKVHLGRGDIVKKKEAADAGEPQGDLEGLGDPAVEDVKKGLTP